jgi:PAS domain S-box-containing protein
MTLPHRLAAVPHRPGSQPSRAAGPAPARAEVAPALFRLLAESALARAALDACGLPLVLAEAGASEPSLCYVNRAFEAFFGHPAAETLGRSAAALLFPDDLSAGRLFREPGTPLLLRARRKDGSPARVEVTAGPVRGVDGRVTHWVLAFADRTELEQLREKLSALRATASGV